MVACGGLCQPFLITRSSMTAAHYTDDIPQTTLLPYPDDRSLVLFHTHVPMLLVQLWIFSIKQTLMFYSDCPFAIVIYYFNISLCIYYFYLLINLTSIITLFNNFDVLDI